jgi:hypothetical protein
VSLLSILFFYPNNNDNDNSEAQRIPPRSGSSHKVYERMVCVHARPHKNPIRREREFNINNLTEMEIQLNKLRTRYARME